MVVFMCFGVLGTTVISQQSTALDFQNTSPVDLESFRVAALELLGNQLF